MVTVQKDDVGKNGCIFQLILKFDAPVSEHGVVVEYPVNKNHYLKVFVDGRRLYRLKLYGDIYVSNSSRQVVSGGKKLEIRMPKKTNINERWTTPGRCSPSRSSSDSS